MFVWFSEAAILKKLNLFFVVLGGCFMCLSSHNFAVVLLAGGRGERAGQAKGLIRVGNEPWLRLQQRVVSRVTPFPLVVVVGSHAESYSEQLSGEPGLCFVRNLAPDLGPFSSLQIGIAASLEHHGNLDGIFVLPIDTPAPVLSVWEELATQVLNGAEAAIPTREGIILDEWDKIDIKPGRSGHPVCLSRRFCSRLLDLDAQDANARLDAQLFLLSREKKSYCETKDFRAFVNLNTLWDWELLAPLVIPNMEIPLAAIPRKRAAAVCLSEQGVLAIAAREPISGKQFLFPPGGAVELGENTVDAARREVFEETGFCVDIHPSREVVTYQLTPWNGRVYSSVTHFFSATLTPAGHRDFLSDDPVIEGREWVPLHRIDEAFGFLPFVLLAVKQCLP